MAEKIRVGIIGTGGIGWMHAHGVKACANTLELAAVCDNNAARLAEFTKAYGGVKTFTDFAELLRDKSIDAVIVLAPHHLHEPMGIAAMEAGKHVLIEKPIARTLEEADRLIAASKRAGVTLMTGHNQRYYPAQQRALELLKQGAIGNVFLAQASHHQNFRNPPGHWWRSKELVGGGCVIGSGIHLLDLLRWQVGEVEELCAHGNYDLDRLEGEVSATVTLKFRNGAVGSFVCDWGHTAKSGYETFALYGKEGHLSRKDERTLLLHAGADESEVHVPTDAYPSMWAHFADCIRTRQEPLTSGPEGRKSLELVIAIYKSMETGKVVKIAE